MTKVERNNDFDQVQAFARSFNQLIIVIDQVMHF